MATGSDNQIYYFKKEFDLKVVKEARVDVSAQARYKLYVNGALAGFGPCKGTREKTFFDTIDVTNYLKVGKNQLYVEVLQLASTDMEGKMSPIEGVLRVSYPLLALELVSAFAETDEIGTVGTEVPDLHAAFRILLVLRTACSHMHVCIINNSFCL